MKLKDLHSGKVTNIADQRAKNEMARDQDVFDQISRELAMDPDVFAIPKFEGKQTPPTRKEFPRKLAVQILQSAIPDQFHAQLEHCTFVVQRRMSDGTRVMDIRADIDIRGFKRNEIYDAHPLEEKLFRLAVMTLVNQMGTLVSNGQFTGSTSATLILN